jgi:glycosyltransferase involved in cell wall biosynthesis
VDTLKLLAKDLDISESVVFTGRVASELAPLYYSLADVSVDPADDSPASSGRAPLKIFESWAMGVPVVTSDVGDRKMLASRYKQSMDLAEKFNALSLAERINHLLTDYKSERKMIPEENLFWDLLILEFINEINHT